MGPKSSQMKIEGESAMKQEGFSDDSDYDSEDEVEKDKKESKLNSEEEKIFSKVQKEMKDE